MGAPVDWTWLRKKYRELEKLSIKLSTEMQRKKRKRTKKTGEYPTTIVFSLWEGMAPFWMTKGVCNIWVVATLEGGERNKETEEMHKVIMTEVFPKLMTNTKPHIRGVRRIPNSINTKKPIPRNTTFNWRKLNKKRISWKKPEREAPSLHRIKDMNYIGHRLKNYARKKRVEFKL